MNPAAAHGFYDIVALLLEQGGNPNLSADVSTSHVDVDENLTWHDDLQ